MPDPYPPKRVLSRTYDKPPYLTQPPAVIPIDVGRQLFVDDFLIRSTTLTRRFHKPKMHPANPVLRRERAWEQSYATPFSDGIFYDPRQHLFRAWYRCDSNTCYATSSDGIRWNKPNLDVEPGTNIVMKGPRDSASVWLDLEERDPALRHKAMIFTKTREENAIEFRASADGIHWSDSLGRGRTYRLPNYDRSTMFFNPFRNVWVYSVRVSNVGPVAAPELADGLGRVRFYKEVRNFQDGWRSREELAPWVGADERDLPDPENKVAPQLYNLDATPYESLLLGLFTVWRGPENNQVKDRAKRNEIVLGYSRDGFHWDRPDRTPFIGVSEKRGDFNWGNVQSVGGGCLIVGDKLYFYFGARRGNPESTPGKSADTDGATGLATLRRDGFASMETTGQGELLTRPVRFQGRHLFVNAEASAGSIQAEIVDSSGNALAGFERARSKPVKKGGTRLALHWKGKRDLSEAAGKTVAIRFFLTNAAIYSFWVSGSPEGASNGYVAAGGLGYAGPRDSR
ncbi:MAG: glycosyl hydrolase family 32 [Bryobacterales bacterium]|nr:glycosyl hydrolase family 32 [Bryobacterales bacterium]